MRPLGYEQPGTLTQGYYPRVDLGHQRGTSSQRIVAPAKHALQTNGPKTDFVASVSGTTMGGCDDLFSLPVTYFPVLL